MQDYLKPNDANNMNKEDAQIIFQIRSKVMNLKMNMKSKYENLECSICFVEEETQEHVYLCEKIWNLKKQNNLNIPKYEEISYGDVYQKLRVSRILKENVKLIEENKT